VHIGKIRAAWQRRVNRVISDACFRCRQLALKAAVQQTSEEVGDAPSRNLSRCSKNLFDHLVSDDHDIGRLDISNSPAL
jgi:hypothetical protein